MLERKYIYQQSALHPNVFSLVSVIKMEDNHFQEFQMDLQRKKNILPFFSIYRCAILDMNTHRSTPQIMTSSPSDRQSVRSRERVQQRALERQMTPEERESASE